MSPLIMNTAIDPRDALDWPVRFNFTPSVLAPPDEKAKSRTLGLTLTEDKECKVESTPAQSQDLL